MHLLKHYPLQLLIVIVIAAIVGGYSYSLKAADESKINSFEDCEAAGYPVMESYPEQCRTPGGKNFARAIDEKIVVTGEAICLPHKGDGPHTLECAFGIKDSNDDYYQIGFLEQDVMLDLQMGKKYTVRGIFTPKPESQYDILGSIDIETFEEVE